MQRRVSALYVRKEALRIGAQLARTDCHCVDHERALAMARALADQMAPRPRFDPPEQIGLLPPVVLGERHQFKCAALHCAMTAVECVRRQVASDSQRTAVRGSSHAEYRGQAGDHPSCKTELCRQGADIRKRLDPSVDVVFIGRGPNGTFDRGRSDLAEQELARQWLKRNGLIENTATLDTPLAAVELEGE